MKESKGITLIALVVTIILLLILAGISITMLTGQNGILKHTGNAKTETTKAGAEEKVQLEVLGSYGADGIIELEKLNDNLKNNIPGLTYNGNEISEDDSNRIKQLPETVEVDGYDVEIKEDGTTEIAVWKQTPDGKITNGEIELSIGDKINYNPVDGATTISYTSSSKANGSKDQAFNLKSYTGTWQLLGVEYGKLLLVSSTIIKTDKGDNFILCGQDGYIKGIEELNKISAIYGQGKGSTGARSIKVEDINKITGYNPEAEKFGYGDINEYGNEVTYAREESSQVTYSARNGIYGTANYSTFKYYDEVSKSFKELDQGNSITLTSSCYGYRSTLATNSKNFEMLFGETSGEGYWIGSTYVITLAGYVHFRIGYALSNGMVSNFTLCHSTGEIHSIGYAVRPVVYLKSTIQLEQDATVGVWNII